MDRIPSIREQEKLYHDELYNRSELYEAGSWLSKPVRTVMELFAELPAAEGMRVLDLGCGVGRNAIALAESLKPMNGRIDCVDLLDSALSGLVRNSRRYGVESHVSPIRADIEHYAIAEHGYDYVLAVSALEHLSSFDALNRKLEEIKRGTRPGGINCLIVGTNITETAVDNGEQLDPLFELRMTPSDLLALFAARYEGWETLASAVNPLAFAIERQGREIKLTTDSVTFAVKKPSSRG